jgi:hypothetical protein
MKVILLPARTDEIDPAAALLADAIRQATLRALRRMEHIDIVDVDPAEFATVVTWNAGRLSRDRQIFDAVTRQFGSGSVAQVSVQSSRDTTSWESRLDVSRPRGGLSTGASVSKNGAAGPDADLESIGLKYAEEIADDNTREREAEEALRAAARSVLIDTTRSEDERVRALTTLLNGRVIPSDRRVDSESVAAAVDLATRSASAETRRQIWAALRLANDTRLAQPMSIALLTDPDAAVRREAALGLNSYLDEAGIPSALERATGSDSSPEVRLAARIARMDYGQQVAFTRETLLDRSLTPAERVAPLRMVEMQVAMGASRYTGAGNAEVELAYAEIIHGTDDPELMLSALSGIQAMTMGRGLFAGPARDADPDPALVSALVHVAEVEDERVQRAALGAMRSYAEQPEIRAVLETVLVDDPQLANELDIAATLSRPPRQDSTVPPE